MSKKSTLSQLFEALGLIVLGLVAMFYRYFVITKVWGYVAVKLFHADPIGLWKAFAISFLVGLMKADFNDKEKTNMEKAQKNLLMVFIGVTLAWGLGYLLFG